MATFAESAPARESTIPEAAHFVQEAAVRAVKASEAFLVARTEWREARAALSDAWAGYTVARERQDDPEVPRFPPDR
jgi:hypothetical protein